MAEFCSDCAKRLGFKNFDIDIIEIGNKLKEGYCEDVLCEGCPISAIGKFKGEIIILKYNSWFNIKTNEEIKPQEILDRYIETIPYIQKS